MKIRPVVITCLFLMAVLVNVGIAYSDDGQASHHDKISHNGSHAAATQSILAILQGEIDPWVVGMALGMALFFGAAHALSPGHGKALVAGYLVGSRGTLRHAVLLGLIVTFAHTFSVIILGVVTLLLTDRFAPEVVYPWIELTSGLMVLGVGFTLLQRRLEQSNANHHHHHHHHHQHEASTTAPLWTLGLSGGIVPCPTALVVLLTAISQHQVVFGLILVLSFSVGLGLVLIVIACAVVMMGDKLRERAESTHSIFGWLPVLSAGFVTVLGAVITYRAVIGMV